MMLGMQVAQPCNMLQKGQFWASFTPTLQHNCLQGGAAPHKHLCGALLGPAPGSTLMHDCLQVEQRFKILWADHGDDISRQYAGTGALKSGFTRTGKRTKMGLLEDGLKSAMRYALELTWNGAAAIQMAACHCVPLPIAVSEEPVVPLDRWSRAPCNAHLSHRTKRLCGFRLDWCLSRQLHRCAACQC